MRVIDRLAKREATWRELDLLLNRLDGRRAGRKPRRNANPRRDDVWIIADDGTDPTPSEDRRNSLGAAEVIRLGELYRAACADLMLAEAYDLPRETIQYLHALVGRAHNALYRSRGFNLRKWAAELFGSVPRQLRRDPYLKASAALFYLTFLIFGLVAAGRPDFSEKILGDSINQLDEMYSQSVQGRARNDAGMAGFYILNNAGIGLRCYGYGLIFAVGTVWTLFQNATQLGAAFGYMAASPNAVNFYTFVTAHAPFELTAIVLSGAAGMRLGMGLVITDGLSRRASLRRAATQTLPTIGAAVFLFILAAFLEGFVSGSDLPYAAKAGIALLSAAMLAAYLMLGGRSMNERQFDDDPALAPHSS
jgi:uncharacterized membrane protein SpoIIM required for sporulation